jgi:hypothetical protein
MSLVFDMAARVRPAARDGVRYFGSILRPLVTASCLINVARVDFMPTYPTPSMQLADNVHRPDHRTSATCGHLHTTYSIPAHCEDDRKPGPHFVSIVRFPSVVTLDRCTSDESISPCGNGRTLDGKQATGFYQADNSSQSLECIQHGHPRNDSRSPRVPKFFPPLSLSSPPPYLYHNFRSIPSYLPARRHTLPTDVKNASRWTTDIFLEGTQVMGVSLIRIQKYTPFWPRFLEWIIETSVHSERLRTTAMQR